MKNTIVVDTGVIVEYLKTGKGMLPDVYEKYTMVVPSSTVTEILASKTFSDKSLEQEVMSFIHKYFKIQDISEEISHKAAMIMRDAEITLAASIMAATAIVGGYKLLTEDRKSYGKVSGLEMLEL